MKLCEQAVVGVQSMNYRQFKQALYEKYARSYDADREVLVGREAMERRIQFFSEPVNDGDAVLDLGCGTGIFLRPAAERNPKGKLLGLDISEAMLELANQRLKGLHNVELRWADISTGLPLPDRSIDTVIASNINYEVPDQEYLMREAFRVLKPCPPERIGVQLVAGLVCLRDRSEVNEAYARVAAEKLMWNFITCDELIEIVRKVGFRIVGHRPVFIENRIINTAIMRRKVKFEGYYRIYEELHRLGYDPSKVSQGHIWVQAIKP